MTRYWGVAGAVLVFLLAGFLIMESFDLPLLNDPTPGLAQAGPLAALLAVALLAGDGVLPVPASLVMVALGALYGPVVGTLLALLGRVLMAMVGYAIGRRGGPLLARLVPPEGRNQADRLLRRWGAMAIVVTRPVPLLAETIVILAGASSIGWRRAGLAALGGSLPEAVVYNLSGSLARSVQETALVWATLLLAACAFWLIGRSVERRLLAPHPTPTRTSG